MAPAGSRNVASTSSPGVVIGLSDENTERMIAIAQPAPTVAETIEQINTSFRRIRSGSLSVAAVLEDCSGWKRYCENARLE